MKNLFPDWHTTLEQSRCSNTHQRINDCLKSKQDLLKKHDTEQRPDNTGTSSPSPSNRSTSQTVLASANSSEHETDGDSDVDLCTKTIAPQPHVQTHSTSQPVGQEVVDMASKVIELFPLGCIRYFDVHLLLYNCKELTASEPLFLLNPPVPATAKSQPPGAKDTPPVASPCRPSRACNPACDTT